MGDSTCLNSIATSNKGHLHVKGVTPDRADMILKAFKSLTGVLALEYLREAQEVRVDFQTELMDQKKLQTILLEIC